jgi:ubiquinone/menaquinone biosynthesis C-methylase UbiE
MSDLFHDRAADWDNQPVPAQISAGVTRALRQRVALGPDDIVLDFGAGTGLIAGAIAPFVAHIHAVDISEAMLTQLAAKPELRGKTTIHRQDLLVEPLDVEVDLIVSAMALHHVADTPGAMRALRRHLRPGGRLALADLDAEDGSFHPPGAEGVFHAGFDRAALGELMRAAGFTDVVFDTATEVTKDGRRYPIFLVTAVA